MSFQYKAGLHSVGNYQVSSIPYMSSSLVAPSSSAAPLEIVFPSVTKTVVVKNETPTSGSNFALRIGVSANGIKGTNFVKINNGEAFSADIKVSKIYLLSDNGTNVSASVFAGLTGIGVDEMNSYSNWSGSIGVG